MVLSFLLALLMLGPDSLFTVVSPPAFVISAPMERGGEILDTLTVQGVSLDPLVLLRQAGKIAVWSYSDSGTDQFGYQTFRFRGGFDITRVSVSLNGVPMNELEDFGVYFNNIPGGFNDVSLSAESGPSLSVGSAGFAGSLAFTSLRPVENKASVSVGIGPWGSSYGHAKAEGPGNRVSLSWGKSDGYRAGAFTEGGSLKIDHWGKNFHVLSLTGAHKNGMAYLGTEQSNPRGNLLGPDEQDDFFTQHMQASIWGGGKEITWRVTPFFTHINGQYGVRFSPEDLATFSLEQGWVGAVGSLYVGPWTIGGETSYFVRGHKMDLAGYSNSGERIVSSANVRRSWDAGSWTITPALSFRNSVFNYDSGDGIIIERGWSFLNGEIVFRNQNGFWVSFSKISREPARNELFGGYDHVGSAELGELEAGGWVTPETAYAGKVGGKFLGLNLEAWTGIYRSEILPTGALSQIGLPLRENWAKSFRQGIDFWGAGKYWELSGSWQSAKVLGEAGFTPILTPAVAFRGGFGPSWARVSSGFISTQWIDVENTAKVPAQIWTDFSSTFSLGGGIQLSAQARNITGQQNWSGGHMGANGPLFFPGIPRSLWVTLNWKTND